MVSEKGQLLRHRELNGTYEEPSLVLTAKKHPY